MSSESDLETYSVYDKKRGEIVDALSGEVLEESLFDERPPRRRRDRDEPEARGFGVLVDERDKKIWSIVWVVGEKIGAPKWLRSEVYWFFKKARVLRARPEIGGRGIYPGDERAVLAVYYVVARKLGAEDVAERIASMPCGDGGAPCYVNRKRGDEKFRRYMKIALRYAALMYPNHTRNPLHLLEYLARSDAPIPGFVYSRAREILMKTHHLIGERRSATVVAAAMKLALEELLPEHKHLFEAVCKKLRVSELAVKNFLSRIKSSNDSLLQLLQY